jgi:hypothetical protein
MTDIMQNVRFHRILVEAASYRVLREIYKSDPSVGPQTAATLRDCLRADRDDVGALQEILKRA